MEHKFEDGDSIEDIWTNAVKGLQAAGVSMNEPEMGLNEVKEKIRNAAASARKTKATDVIEKSFNCVLDLGNIASSGASIVSLPDIQHRSTIGLCALDRPWKLIR